MTQEAIDAAYGIKRTSWADRERRRKRLSKRITQDLLKQAVVEQLRSDPAAALAELRGGEPKGRAYLVKTPFVTFNGGLKRGTIVEIAGGTADIARYITPLEPPNEFENEEPRSFEILFVP